MASGLEEKVPVSGLEEKVSRMAVHGGIEEVKKDSQRDSRVVIAAIDFGTTYSGYAYAFKSDLDKAKDTKEMCNILMKTWQSGSDAGLISHKTPTCLLLNSEGNFDSFGFQAEEKYNNLTNDNAHVGWRFFRRFKMILLNEKHLSKETVIPDDQNNNLEAVAVFAHSIKYIKNELWNQLQKTGYSIDDKEIQWVLTIPAIWNPRSKQFMRLAAEKAGIPGNQLEFALEPEAAAVYVKETKVAKESVSADEHQLVPFKPGTQFMVLDLGGGTIDISVKEVLKDRTLKELHRASGNGLGGESVNIRFLEFFESVFGKDSWSKFKNENEYKAAFYDLENEIEQKKRTLPFDNRGNLKINIPPDLVEIIDKNDNDFKEHVESLKGLRYKSGRLYIDKEIVRGVFEPSVTSIIKLVHEILNGSNVGHVSNIIMVGGFSQSPLVCKVIKDVFSDRNVIIPNVADMAVLQGAVIYRHWPEVVRTHQHTSSMTNIPTVLKTATAQVTNGETVMDTTVLFDEGSQRSYITEELAQNLNLKQTGTETLMNGVFGGKVMMQTLKTSTLFLIADSGERIQIYVLIIPCIVTKIHAHQVPIKNLPYLKGLKLAHSYDGSTFEVSLLIGVDHYWDIVGNDIIRGPGPTAVSSKIGYLLSGPTYSRAKHNHVVSYNILSYHRREELNLEKLWK